jgi:hypothetical protein
MAMTQTLAENIRRNLIDGSTGGSSQTNCYLAILTGAPTSAGDVTDVEIPFSTGYARVECGRAMSGLSYDSSEKCFYFTNSQKITFPWVDQEVTGAAYWAILPSATGKTALAYGTLESTVNLAAKQAYAFAAGKLKIILK